MGRRKIKQDLSKKMNAKKVKTVKNAKRNGIKLHQTKKVISHVGVKNVMAIQKKNGKGKHKKSKRKRNGRNNNKNEDNNSSEMNKEKKKKKKKKVEGNTGRKYTKERPDNQEKVDKKVNSMVSSLGLASLPSKADLDSLHCVYHQVASLLRDCAQDKLNQ